MEFNANKIENTSKWDYALPSLPLYKVIIINCFLGLILNLFLHFKFIFSIKWIAEVCFNSALIGTLIWKGCEYITHYLVKKYPWLKNPIKRIVFNVLYLFLYSAFIVLLFNSLIRWILHGYSFSAFILDLPLILTLAFLIPVFSNLIIYSYIFLKNWKGAVIREEVLKREHLSLQYESLKTQVNPQFLFNSLDTLKLLVLKNANTAARYVKQLSSVYRYLLDHKDKEVVTLNEEIEFLKNYCELLKHQYSERISIIFDIHIDNQAFVFPLLLQIILEKAIENGLIVNNFKTNIEFRNTQNYLFVSFTSDLTDLVTNNQIANIFGRYKQFSGKSITTEFENNTFILKIPLIFSAS
jgi:two-component system, LytTR family, sensor kinase